MPRVCVKVWIEEGGEPVFGEGRARLLEEIERTGSISAAARSLGMSYRHAWDHVKKMETRLGQPLVARRSGGHAGGGSRLTAFGKRMLRDFARLRQDVSGFLAGRKTRSP